MIGARVPLPHIHLQRLPKPQKAVSCVFDTTFHPSNKFCIGTVMHQGKYSMSQLLILIDSVSTSCRLRGHIPSSVDIIDRTPIDSGR